MQHGAHFSIFAAPEAKARLITDGLYSRLSNPIYIFGSVCVLCFSVAVGRHEVLVVAVLMTFAQLLRARREAIALKRRFGEEYDEYMERVWC